jgi:hypothetical protein
MVRSFAVGYQCFGGPCCLHPQGEGLQVWVVMLCSVGEDTNVLDGLAASIFRVKVYKFEL